MTVIFRAKEQMEALELILSGVQELIVVLPTGGGKSILFMLPVHHLPPSTTATTCCGEEMTVNAMGDTASSVFPHFF